MVTIGYQGVEGSNSEEAARQLAEKHKFRNYTLMPLVSSFNVLDNVIKKRIDYGVVAVSNNKGGIVEESKTVLDHLNIPKFDTITIPITHFLFVKNDSINFKDIKEIASHPQAFKQCKNTLKENFASCRLVTDEDTATAARKLSLGILPKTTAVLCRKNAGLMNCLHLLVSNLEDKTDNKTTFEMY